MTILIVTGIKFQSLLVTKILYIAQIDRNMIISLLPHLFTTSSDNSRYQIFPDRPQLKF